MRPDIKRMNERLGYFLHEMDLANAHVDHAEREIERLEKKLADQDSELKIYKRAMLYAGDREAYELTIEQLKQENTQLKEENYWLKQSVETENDRLKRNEELSTENARLMRALVLLKEDMKIVKTENERLEDKLASKEKLLVSKLSPAPTCKCGKLAGYNVLGTYYCSDCVTKVIKL